MSTNNKRANGQLHNVHQEFHRYSETLIIFFLIPITKPTTVLIDLLENHPSAALFNCTVADKSSVDYVDQVYHSQMRFRRLPNQKTGRHTPVNREHTSRYACECVGRNSIITMQGEIMFGRRFRTHPRGLWGLSIIAEMIYGMGLNEDTQGK